MRNSRAVHTRGLRITLWPAILRDAIRVDVEVDEELYFCICKVAFYINGLNDNDNDKINIFVIQV